MKTASKIKIVPAAAVLALLMMFSTAPVCLLAQAPTQTAQAQTATQPTSADAAKSDNKSSEQEEPDENDQYKQSPVVKMFGGWFGMPVERAANVFWWLNFIVLAVVIAWALLRALPKLFRDRTNTIQKQIVEARAATEQANARLAAIEKKLTTLDGEIASLHATGEAEIAGEEARIKASLESEKQRILTASEQDIATAAALAQRQLKQFAAGLAIDHAVKNMSLSSKTEKLLVDEFATGIGASNAASNAASNGKAKASASKNVEAPKAKKTVAAKTSAPAKVVKAAKATKSTTGGKN